MEGRASEVAVKALVEHYSLNEDQEWRLKFVAKRTKFVPTVAEVEWVVEEAKLRDGNKDLDYFMFPYMEFYPWYLRSKGTDFRLYVGAFKKYDGETWPLWMRFNQTTEGPETSLYLTGPEEGVPAQQEPLNLPEYRRSFITWWFPFDHLFQLGNMSPEDPEDESKAKIAASLQDDYFTATVKVLARFPGLIMEQVPEDRSKNRQVYSDYSAFPFFHKEALSPAKPLVKLLEMFGWDMEATTAEDDVGSKDASEKTAFIGDDQTQNDESPESEAANLTDGNHHPVSDLTVRKDTERKISSAKHINARVAKIRQLAHECGPELDFLTRFVGRDWSDFESNH